MAEKKEDNLLVPRDQYLAAGIHIGTQIKTQDMIPFIYRITRSGLYVIDIRKTDERLRIAASYISRYDPMKVLVVSARRYGHQPIRKFSELLGSHFVAGRFVPGTLTNHTSYQFVEADLVVITDPRADRQALKETVIAKIPTVGLCDTDNNSINLDLVVPTNNRGKKALALIFWLLTRHVLFEKGEIQSIDEFDVLLSEFISQIQTTPER
ncbi:MAG: 30S ribosomal protein S2 [Candidatus Helarchaeota archaeon]|nr:30S ribosomal protein S2 [Candidatus Helarchaeota archaeon]